MNTIHVEDPQALGFNPARLARIKPFFDSYIAEQKLSGYGVLLARKNRVALNLFSGTSAFAQDAGGGFALDERSIFRIYSMTKPITSIALMMLYEEGKFNLFDPVHKFIPAFKDMEVFESGTPQNYTTRKAARDITIHDLLTHQSGLTYDFLLEHPVDALYRNARINGAYSEKYDLPALADKLATLPLIADPGAQWNYSVSTDICGHLIELISGQSLDIFFQDRLFDPLGMKDTSFTLPPEKKARFTHNYNRDPLSKNIKLVDHPEKTIYQPGRRFLSGGGGLLSTTYDYLQFCTFLHNHGKVGNKQLIARKTLAFMRRNHLPNNETLMERAQGSFSEVSQRGVGFGLGFSVVVDESATITVSSHGNYAWGGLASTFFWIDPVEDLTVIFMTQLMPSSSYPLGAQLRQLVYAALD